MPTSRMRVVQVERVEVEAPHTRTFYFPDEPRARPGQFVMVWLPGVDERPMALSQLGATKGVTVKDTSDFTHALFDLQEGGRLGLRGPLGTAYDLSGERYLLAAGGTGIASLVPAGEALAEAGKKAVTAFGAATKEDLILLDRVRKVGEVQVATDDGSAGYHGNVSDLVEKLLDERRFDGLLACGPEAMLHRLADVCREAGVPFQASLERFMRCGLGLCGSCSLDSYLVCVDGPIFRGDQLADLRDFGAYRRDKTGRRVPVEAR